MKVIEVQGRNVLVDDEEYERLRVKLWLINEGYCYCRPMLTYMHQMLIECPKGYFIDHINRNKIDNQKDNLRIVTGVQNGFNRGLNTNNSSGYKGVSWSTAKQKYEAKIAIKKRTIHLGRFSTKEEAARAYNRAATSLIGETAFLNVILESSI